MLQKLKSWLQQLHDKAVGYRTLLWNAFCVSVAPILLFGTDWLQVNQDKFNLSPTKVLALVVGVKAVDSWLRVITVGPVGSKGVEEPTPETKAGD